MCVGVKDSAYGNIGYKHQLINVLLSQVMPQSDQLKLNHLSEYSLVLVLLSRCLGFYSALKNVLYVNFVIILHVKDYMYGNIGYGDRLSQYISQAYC